MYSHTRPKRVGLCTVYLDYIELSQRNTKTADVRDVESNQDFDVVFGTTQYKGETC